MVKKITGVFTTLDAEGNEVELYPEGTLGSDNSVTLTRAEYDALSDAEKNSDTTYYISDEDAQPNAFSVPFTSDKYTASNTGDALIEVKTELEETNSNLTASDSTPFRFGVNESGEYGYIVTDSEGADTVIPFKKFSTPEVLYSYGVMGSGHGTVSTTKTMPRNGYCVVFAETCGANSWYNPTIKLNGTTQSLLSSYKVDVNTKGSSVCCFEVKKDDTVYVSAPKDSASSGKAGIIMIII